MERAGEWEQLFRSVERMAIRVKMPVPRIYMIQEYSPNAFALGLSRQGSVIAVTEGLLRILTNEEIEAVVCLCLAQLRLKEYRRSPLASFLALPFFLLARRLPVVFSQILRSFGSLIIWIFVRPERIFLGDAYAAQVFQKPSAIARALRKMTSLCRMVPLTQQNLALDHLFLISTYKEEDWVVDFSTHPALEERIRRLLDLSLTC